MEYIDEKTGEVFKSVKDNKIDDRREIDMQLFPDLPHRWWPFEVGKSYGGEGYGWGYWDRYSEFGDRISRENERWIAGKRPQDPSSVSGYAGYTGIDCSGLVSRVLGLKRHHSTSELPSLCLAISPEELKKGDIINKSGEHVVLFIGWIEKPWLANIIHSSSYLYKQDNYVWRVVNDIATVKGSIKDKTLAATEKKGYYPYTPFPIFRDWVPLKNSLINNATPQIKVKIRSGTDIIADSIVMKVDDVVVYPIISPSSDAKEILVSYIPQNTI